MKNRSVSQGNMVDGTIKITKFGYFYNKKTKQLDSAPYSYFLNLFPIIYYR